MKEERQLKMFECEGDTVIAYDAEDAAKVWEETIGEPWWSDSGDQWAESGNAELTICYDDRPSTIPRGAELEEPCFENEDRWLVKASTEAWVQAIGRGWLCSENY